MPPPPPRYSWTNILNAPTPQLVTCNTLLILCCVHADNRAKSWSAVDSSSDSGLLRCVFHVNLHHLSFPLLF